MALSKVARSEHGCSVGSRAPPTMLLTRATGVCLPGLRGGGLPCPPQAQHTTTKQTLPPRRCWGARHAERALLHSQGEFRGGPAPVAWTTPSPSQPRLCKQASLRHTAKHSQACACKHIQTHARTHAGEHIHARTNTRTWAHSAHPRQLVKGHASSSGT